MGNTRFTSVSKNRRCGFRNTIYIAQYAFLHRLIVKEVGLKSRKIYWNLADKSFYDININDIKIEGYNQAKDNYKYEVAI